MRRKLILGLGKLKEGVSTIKSLKISIIIFFFNEYRINQFSIFSFYHNQSECSVTISKKNNNPCCTVVYLINGEKLSVFILDAEFWNITLIAKWPYISIIL